MLVSSIALFALASVAAANINARHAGHDHNTTDAANATVSTSAGASADVSASAPVPSGSAAPSGSGAGAMAPLSAAAVVAGVMAGVAVL